MKSRRPVLAAGGVLVALFVGIAVYEYLAFDWHFAREEAPGASAWDGLRTVLIAGASFALIATLGRCPRQLTDDPPPGRGTIALASTLALLALAVTLVLPFDPVIYHRIVEEDSVVEWATALALFAASGMMALRLRALLGEPATRPWHWPHVLLAAGFAALFALMALEEVSWFQRQIGFSTPEPVAQINWQGEFNLHNLHTDITEYALFSGTGIFLILFPLVRERLADWPILRPVLRLLPDRAVAALSVPMLMFAYGHWNLPPVQAVFWIGLAACILFATSAGSAGERRLWWQLFAVVALGQLAHLMWGRTMIEIFDSTEYRELFLSLGLAAYAWRQWRAPERLTQT